jgi:putative peptidoglycan lipid II flippase
MSAQTGHSTDPSPRQSGHRPGKVEDAAPDATRRVGQRSVLQAAGTISAAILTSRVLGLVRESLFAAIFGAQKVADAFVLAYRIPNLLRELFAEGTMASAFVPTFTATLRNEGQERAYALGNLLISVLLVLTGALAVLGIVFADVIVDVMAPGFRHDPSKRTIAISAARVMMPFLPLISWAAAAMGMLNAQRRFFVPALAPAVFNVASIIVGLYLWVRQYPPDRAVLGWSIGAVISAAVQLAAQVPSLYRLGWRFRPALAGVFTDPALRRIGRLMGPAVIGLAAVQINVLVNSIFASNLGDGPMAQLNYGWRLFYLPLGLFGVAIATVTTTTVAEEVARGDAEGLRNRVAHSLKLTWMLTLPSALGLMAVSVPAIRMIYERGAFGASDTEATASVLVAYMIGLAPYSSVKTLGPAFYALDRPRIPMIASLTSVAVNITFNALTYRWLGAVGLATGSALGACANILILIIAFRWLVGPMRGQGMASAGLRILVASVATGGLAWAFWKLLEGALAGAGQGFWSRNAVSLLTLLVPVAAGTLAYVGLCKLLGLPEIEELLSPIRRRLRRGS